MKPGVRTIVGGSASALCLGLASTAHAVCMSSDSSLGVGMPSISATEVSTTQVVEMVHQRQQQEQGAVPTSAAEPAPAPAAAPPPAPKPAPVAAQPAPKAKTVAQTVSKAAPKAKATAEADEPAAPKAKKPAEAASAAKKQVKDEPAVAAEKPSKTYVPPSTKDEAVVVSTPRNTRYADEAPLSGTVGRSSGFGVWAQGYGDFEHRSGLTIDVARPGEISRNQWSGGFLVGADRTFHHGPASGITLGVFGGHNTTHAKESAGVFRDAQNGPTENFLRSDAKQDTAGGFAGAYAALFANKFALQAVFKADFYRVSQQDRLQAQFDDGGACGLPPETRNGEANLNNYITEVNASYRIDLSRSAWLEPITGFRLTYTEINNETGNVGFGRDGHVLRLQGGLRVAQIWPMHQGFLMTSLTGMLYSDVVVSGFQSGAGEFAPATPINDEGKLRVMGQIATRYVVGNGSSYDVQLEGRGGEHLSGFGGRLGARYEW